MGASRDCSQNSRRESNSRQAPKIKEHYLEWKADQALSTALKQRCKAEGVSIHAALVVMLDRALFTVLGKKKAPALIESPMDARRGRLAALKSDMLFFGGGSLEIPTGLARELDFWARAREIHEHLRQNVELVSYNQSQVICKEGEEADAFYLIRSGIVSLRW